jgi:hypothetical protein
MATTAEIASFLNGFIARRPGVSGTAEAWPQPIGWFVERPTVQELADELSTDAEFRALQLADFFNSPNGELIAAGVRLVIPEAYAADFGLFVEAMKLAAQSQRRVGPKLAGLAAATIIAAFIASALRSA